MQPIKPSVAFVCSLPIGAFVYLVGARWQVALGLGIILPLLMAYMAMISLARERQLAWELCDTRWYWLLAFPLVLTLLAIASLLIMIAGNLPDIFAHASTVMIATGFLLIALAGCIVIALDLMGKIPLKRP